MESCESAVSESEYGEPAAGTGLGTLLLSTTQGYLLFGFFNS